MKIRAIAAVFLLASLFAMTPVWAQEKIPRLVVAFPPGGPVDLVARTIADQLGKELNQRVIVENKPGANGAIAAQNVAQSAPDGTTLWLTSVGAAAINPVLYDKLPYDMQRDFSPGGRGHHLVDRVKADIRAGKFKPMPEGEPSAGE